MPTLLWRVPPPTGSPCPRRNLARIPGSHMEQAPVRPASGPDPFPCPCSVRSHHGDCVQRPGSALARNAELSRTIYAKRACRDQLRHTRESVAVRRMAAPSTWRADMTDDSTTTRGPHHAQSVMWAPGRRSMALAQGDPEHASPHTWLMPHCLAARGNSTSVHAGLPRLTPSLLCAPFGTAWSDAQCSLHPCLKGSSACIQVK
jgi:hypothetical protein